MAMIERRSGVGHLPRGKRLLRGLLPLLKYGRVILLAMAAGMTCVLAAGCDRSHEDVDAPAHAADATPMLPGTRAAAASAPSIGAQRFDTSDGTQTRAASDALLPPVMHTAD